jgi:hypothetical protein
VNDDDVTAHRYGRLALRVYIPRHGTAAVTRSLRRTSSGFPEGVDPRTVIDDLIVSNQKIRAITTIRAAYGTSLREALDGMIARYEQLRAEQPDTFTISHEEWGHGFYS